MDGLAVSWRDVPEALIKQYRLEQRVIIRSPGAEREIRFLYRDTPALIPVWHERQFLICTWGNQDRRLTLPRTGCIGQEILDTFRGLVPEAVEIPTTFGFERGVWYQIKEGMRGVLVRDPAGRPHVYVLTIPSSHYYQVMTRSHRMPILIGEQI